MVYVKSKILICTWVVDGEGASRGRWTPWLKCGQGDRISWLGLSIPNLYMHLVIVVDAMAEVWAGRSSSMHTFFDLRSAVGSRCET